MDKTAWFVVTTCIVLLGLNYWYTEQQQQAAPAAITAPADPTAAADPTVPADPTAPATSPTENTTAAPEPAKAQELVSLTAKDKEGNPVACFHFRDIGGSISSIEMIGKAINSTKEELHGNVHLNSQAAQGIGTLMYNLKNDDEAPIYEQAVYHIVPEATNDQQVTLESKLFNNIIRKTYTLKPLQQGEDTIEGNAYCLHLSLQVINGNDSPREFKNWAIYAGAAAPISSDERGQYTYYIRHEDGSFHKENPGSFRPFFGKNRDRLYQTNADKLGWGGVMNQYYATLVRPVGSSSDVNAYYAAPLKVTVPGKEEGETAEGVEFGVGIPTFRIEKEGVANDTHRLEYDIFAGPKLNLMLSEMTKEFPKIDHIMDYGIFHIISYPMNWLINVFYGWFGNWGWAIVAMTFVIRLLIWPLYRKSYLSMKRMSLLQPKMQELREKYPNDQQKVSMEMMKLYREYGVSPLGGCLPMFLQIPIFFSFFYVLQTAAEFRGAPFIGWVTDLSQMDTICTLPILGYNIPINVLPIIMAVTMVLQMRMSPQAGDPNTQRIMRLMPLFFFAFCYVFPSALALYWTTTNIISIIQTWIIRRMPQPELQRVAPQKGPRKKGFFERMAEAQQAALAEQKRRQQNRSN